MQQLEATPGEHLVIVNYSHHIVDHEWVYNSADIDKSKIVWARNIPGLDLKPLIKYFRKRKIWTIDADSGDVQLHACIDPVCATVQ